MHQPSTYKKKPPPEDSSRCCGYMGQIMNWLKLAQWTFSSISSMRMEVSYCFEYILWTFIRDKQRAWVNSRSEFNIREYLVLKSTFLKKISVKELVTPPLNGLILPGITRDSILTLARQWGDCIVSERSITMHEICKLVQEERVSFNLDNNILHLK